MKICVIALLVAFVFSLSFCLILIPILRKIKAGQNILGYVKEHKNKNGTPTMGGLAFIIAALLTAALFIRGIKRPVLLCFAIGLSYMIIGFLDDILKKIHRENLGLKAWQKFSFQVFVAVFAGIYCYRAGLTKVNLPFLNRTWEIGWGIVPFSVFAFLATVNAVNLTDGLDGLAAGSSVPFFASLGSVILLQKGETSLSVLSFCLVGALLAYLIFNVPPASVFMGDTGSLALGGFASSIAIFSGNVLFIPILGFVFVVSVITVVAQVIYYKVTGGKRIFLMAPVHHHFQEKGHSESKISYMYAVISLLLGLVGILSVM